MSVKLGKFSNPSILTLVMGVQYATALMSINGMFSFINKKIDFGKVEKCSDQSISAFVLGARKNCLLI